MLLSYRGIANRRDYRFLDQLSMVAFLQGLSPAEGDPFRFRGWLGDMLQEGEQLGGVGFEPVPFIPTQRWNKITANQRNLLQWIATASRSELYDVVTAYMAGIMDKEGKPKGTITFTLGPRQEKRRENKVTSKIQVTELSNT